MTVKIKRLHENAAIPTYAHGPDEDAGMDLRSIGEVILLPGVPTLVKTGISIELPSGYEAQVRPRSGLALKHGISMPNSPATIDPGYRGELGVILAWGGRNPNLRRWSRLGRPPIWVEMGSEEESNMYAGLQAGSTPPWECWCAADSYAYRVAPGERIAQMVIARYERVEWVEGELSDSVRGTGGFGSSGV